MGSGVITPHVIRYCAQECEWQMSGEMSVFNMVEAWRHAHFRRRRPITLRNVLELGRLVEPRVNRDGIRKVGVRVGSDVKLDPWLVSAALDALIKNQPRIPALDKHATEWFRHYEEIHPFVDGNGRTGTLLWNWLRNTLSEPEHVPNLWHDPRRDPL